MLRQALPDILHFERTQGLSAHEYRLRRLENIMNRNLNISSQENIIQFCNHVERFYADVLQSNNLKE